MQVRGWQAAVPTKARISSPVEGGSTFCRSNPVSCVLSPTLAAAPVAAAAPRRSVAPSPLFYVCMDVCMCRNRLLHRAPVHDSFDQTATTIPGSQWTKPLQCGRPPAPSPLELPRPHFPRRNPDIPLRGGTSSLPTCRYLGQICRC